MKAKILSVVATLLMIILILVALPLTIPKLMGYQIYSVLTASMTPALPVGCAVYVRECAPETLERGAGKVPHGVGRAIRP